MTSDPLQMKRKESHCKGQQISSWILLGKVPVCMGAGQASLAKSRSNWKEGGGRGMGLSHGQESWGRHLGC